jgi:succinate dehydrogenase / fumarate reductase membrane anchor subunit
MQIKNDFRTQLNKCKGLGSAKDGANHWWMQRLTALGLLPLVIWFVVTILKITMSNQIGLIEIIRSPINLTMLILFLVVSIYHGMLGMKVIIEDYVHAEGTKFALIILLQFISVVSILVGLTAIITFYISAII